MNIFIYGHVRAWIYKYAYYIYKKKYRWKIYMYIFLTYTHMKFIVFENYLKYKWINLCKFTNYRQLIIKVYKFVLKIVF